MDELKRTQLEAAGVDVEDALERFMGNEALLLSFLLRFPQDENFARLKQAMAAGDAVGAFEAAHTLKGVTANLSLTALSQQIGPLVEELRGGALEAAAARLPAVEADYRQLVTRLSQLA